MNRRGFMAAILAAPLAAVGIFAGIHTTYSTGSWGEVVAGRMAGPDGFAKVKVVGLWTNLYPDSPWTYIELVDGKIIRNEKWDKLPFHGFGDLCGSACDN